MKKIKLNKLSRKIKRLVEIHGFIRLEVYSGSKRNPVPYVTRHLYNNGSCRTRYWTPFALFGGRETCTSCFLDDYCEYENLNGDKIIKMSLIDTLKAMQKHDEKFYEVKYIYAGGRKIGVDGNK